MMKNLNMQIKYTMSNVINRHILHQQNSLYNCIDWFGITSSIILATLFLPANTNTTMIVLLHLTNFFIALVNLLRVIILNTNTLTETIDLSRCISLLTYVQQSSDIVSESTEYVS